MILCQHSAQWFLFFQFNIYNFENVIFQATMKMDITELGLV
jgi:hypothetical protein